MVQCSKCTFGTKYPRGAKCWQLEKPLCGDCAYELDHKLNKKLAQLEKNPLIRKFLQDEVIPILLKYNQKTIFKLYEKTYIRKPSTRGGRLSQKNSNITPLIVS